MTSWLVYPLSIADQQVHIDQSERFLSMLSLEIRPFCTGLRRARRDCSRLLSKAFCPKSRASHFAYAADLSSPCRWHSSAGRARLTQPDVILPAGHPLILADVVESYRWFGEAWVQTLRTFNIKTHTVSLKKHIHNKLYAARKLPVSMNSCYNVPATALSLL